MRPEEDTRSCVHLLHQLEGAPVSKVLDIAALEERKSGFGRHSCAVRQVDGYCTTRTGIRRTGTPCGLFRLNLGADLCVQSDLETSTPQESGNIFREGSAPQSVRTLAALVGRTDHQGLASALGREGYCPRRPLRTFLGRPNGILSVWSRRAVPAKPGCWQSRHSSKVEQAERNSRALVKWALIRLRLTRDFSARCRPQLGAAQGILQVCEPRAGAADAEDGRSCRNAAGRRSIVRRPTAPAGICERARGAVSPAQSSDRAGPILMIRINKR